MIETCPANDCKRGVRRYHVLIPCQDRCRTSRSLVEQPFAFWLVLKRPNGLSGRSMSKLDCQYDGNAKYEDIRLPIIAGQEM